MAGRREQEIIDAYESWNPDESTVSDLVDRLGISRQRLYDVLDRNGVVPKSKRGPGAVGRIEGDMLNEMAEMALGYLLGQLQACRDELARYRQSYGFLDDA
jgi:hypothetical protein